MSDTATTPPGGSRGRAAERGVALVMVMVFMALMLLLGLAVTLASITDLDVSTSTKLTIDAFNTAERGQSHAYELIRNMRGDFTCLLRGEDGVLKSGDEFEDWTGPVRAFNLDGTQKPENIWPMFNPGAAADIDQESTDGGSKTRAIKRVDNRHFYELVVYDDAHDPNSFLTDLELELGTDPNATNPAVARTVDCDSRVLVRSIGYVMREDVNSVGEFDIDKVLASATIDAVIGLIAHPAVVVDGDLTVAGSATINGTLGSVHANDDLTLQGNGHEIANTATWSNADGVGSNPSFTDPGGHPAIVGYHESINVPSLNPLDYADQVDVIYLHRNATPQDKEQALTRLAPYQVSYDADAPDVITVNGVPTSGVSGQDFFLVRSGVGTPTYTLYAPSDPMAPAYTAGVVATSGTGNWSVDVSIAGGASSTTGKSYLIVTPVNTSHDGRVSFTSFGARRWISVFTNGSVVMDGNFDIAPAVDILVNTTPPPPPWNRVKVLVMAGTDVFMRGSGGALAEGLVYAHEQFEGQGNVTLKGQLFAKNQSLATPGFPNTSGSKVDATGSSLSGSFDLIFNSSVGFFGTYAIVSWRELRDFNPADARP